MELNSQSNEVLNKIKDNFLIFRSYLNNGIQYSEYKRSSEYPKKEIRNKYMTNNKYDLLKSEELRLNKLNSLKFKKRLPESFLLKVHCNDLFHKVLKTK